MAVRAYSGPDMSAAPLLTIAQVAERLAVHRTTVADLLARGDLRRITIGARTVRIDPDDLARYLRRSTERRAS